MGAVPGKDRRLITLLEFHVLLLRFKAMEGENDVFQRISLLINGAQGREWYKNVFPHRIFPRFVHTDHPVHQVADLDVTSHHPFVIRPAVQQVLYVAHRQHGDFLAGGDIPGVDRTTGDDLNLVHLPVLGIDASEMAIHGTFAIAYLHPALGQ